MALYMQKSSTVTANLPVSEAERAARLQLAGCYRVFAQIGWAETIFNHITLRVPGPERVFLINPFGLHYREVTASNLVAVDIDGNPVRTTQYPINRAGFVIHSAIHANVDDAHCVMHTHTTTGMAVSCLKDGLSHNTFNGAQLQGRVAYHEFEGGRTEADARCDRRQARRYPAQPRPSDDRSHAARGVCHDVHPAARLRRADRGERRRHDEPDQ